MQRERLQDEFTSALNSFQVNVDKCVLIYDMLLIITVHKYRPYKG